MHHELKTVNPHFRKVGLGLKTFELRKNDRDFHSGDTLKLIEYIPEAVDGKFTGNYIDAVITHMLEDYQGIENGYCILSIRVIKVYVFEGTTE